MKTRVLIGTLLLAICTVGAAIAQEKATMTSVLTDELKQVEKEVIPAAEAMPDDKFNFAPTSPGDFKGVRTFALQVKHIAVANYAIGAAILGEKPPVPLTGPNGPQNITSKADIIKFLKDSYAYADKAVDSVNESNAYAPIKSPFGDHTTNRLALSIGILSHPWDHYGQMVEYLRMNAIIPPASRK